MFLCNSTVFTSKFDLSDVSFVGLHLVTKTLYSYNVHLGSLTAVRALEGTSNSFSEPVYNRSGVIQLSIH
jgi:hypothetical protein